MSSRFATAAGVAKGGRDCAPARARSLTTVCRYSVSRARNNTRTKRTLRDTRATAHDDTFKQQPSNERALNVAARERRQRGEIYSWFIHGLYGAVSPPLPPPPPPPPHPCPSAARNALCVRERPSVSLRHSPRYRARARSSIVVRGGPPSTSPSVSPECTASSLRAGKRCD